MLCFLLWVEKQNDIKNIRRCNFCIPYFYEKERSYLPDFVLIKEDLSKILVEVKCTKWKYYNEEKTFHKNIAAQKFVSENCFESFEFVSEEHKWSEEIDFKRSAKIKPLVKKLWKESKLTIFKEKQRERYIGKIKEQKDL